MATNIPDVQGQSIAHCALIKLTLGATTYYLSSAYKPLVWETNVYTELGAFLSVSSIVDDFKTTNGDISLTLSGIPSNADYLGIILSSPVKGGEIEIYRGFFDPTTLIISSIVPRYKGIITNFAIEETTSFLSGELVNAVSVTCASINTLLENKIAGQRTNGTDRKKFFPGDISFDRVKDLQNTGFDFGKEYAGGTGYSGGGGGPGQGRREQQR